MKLLPSKVISVTWNNLNGTRLRALKRLEQQQQNGGGETAKDKWIVTCDVYETLGSRVTNFTFPNRRKKETRFTFSHFHSCITDNNMWKYNRADYSYRVREQFESSMHTWWLSVYDFAGGLKQLRQLDSTTTSENEARAVCFSTFCVLPLKSYYIGYWSKNSQILCHHWTPRCVGVGFCLCSWQCCRCSVFFFLMIMENSLIDLIDGDWNLHGFTTHRR